MLRTLLTLGAVLGLTTALPLLAADKEHAEHGKPPIPKEGVAVLVPTQGHDVSGTLMFAERDGAVQITGKVWNLTPGKHGFHIHEFGDLRSKDGKSAGGHYSPEGHKHGAPGDEEHHAGDLGNITANDKGVAMVDIKADWLKLHFIIGRGVVVHAKADDLQSQPSGDAGGRVAVGVIGFAEVKDTKTADAK